MDKIIYFLSRQLVIVILLCAAFVSGCQSFEIDYLTEPEITTAFKNMDKKLKTLKDLSWKHRIILIEEKTDKGLDQLRKAKDEISERDVIWFRLGGGEIETNYEGELSEDFAAYLKKNFFEKHGKRVFLIGKDGTIKSKDEILDLKNYFNQIDSMPMRQREMKDIKKNEY